MFTSRKPEAKAFRLWVTDEVLPAIWATGRYEGVRARVDPRPQASSLLPWNLPAPGRFVVTRWPGRPDHVRETERDEAMGAVVAMDVKLLAYAIKTVEAHWHRARHFTSVDKPAKAVCPRLEQAVLDAGKLAQDYVPTLGPAEMHTMAGVTSVLRQLRREPADGSHSSQDDISNKKL